MTNTKTTTEKKVTYDNCTGLIYFDTVPFTVQTLTALGNVFNGMTDQFETEVVVKDKINGGKVTITEARLDMLLNKVEEVGINKIASNWDF